MKEEKSVSLHANQTDGFLLSEENSTERIDRRSDLRQDADPVGAQSSIFSQFSPNTVQRKDIRFQPLDTDILLVDCEEEPPVPLNLGLLSRSRRLLYLSHLFSQFSEISWQFGLTLFLAAFANYESLILVSTYGIVSGLAVCVSGSLVGRFIDCSNRLLVAQRFIWMENLSVVAATILCYLLLKGPRTNDNILEESSLNATSSHTEMPSLEGQIWSWLKQRLDGVPLDTLSLSLLIGIHVLGSIARVLDRGFLVSIERDWVVVMSRMASPRYGESSDEDALDTSAQLPDAQEKAWLSETNVAMKQIDLSCKVVAPAVAGFCIASLDDGRDPHHGGDLAGAALLVGGINVASLIVEYVCTLKIYSMIPELALKAPCPSNPVDHDDVCEHRAIPREETAFENGAAYERPALAWGVCKLPYGLGTYLQQQISMAGLGLALLYLNALSFGATMTAYLVWRGMGLQTVGVWRGVSCAIGLFGTFVYHQSARCLSLESTGMWSILFQFLCLSLSYFSLFVDDYTTSLVMLIGGVCASRVGLWVFDIAVTQQMQEYVPPHVRGVVGSVQESLNAFFELLSFGLGIVFPDPRKFHIYVSAGYTSVGIAVMLYAFGVFFRRGKLVPQ